MSKLGYIYKSYGSQFNIGIANTYGYNVLSSGSLPNNYLIISSPVDDNNNDIGSYSLIATDYLNNPVRLTYTIKEGNGIIYQDDSLQVNIDNNTIIEKDNKLSANIAALIDNDTLKYTEDGELYISYDNLNKASENEPGLFKIDENTVKIADKTIFVDTAQLNVADSSTKLKGIAIGDNKTIISDQGILSVEQTNIKKASSEDFGTIYSDNDTINIKNGIISVNTERLDSCESDRSGIVIPDNKTIYLENNVLNVRTENLNKVGDFPQGVFKYDDKSFILDDETLKVKDTDELLESIEDIKEKTEQVKQFDEDIDYLLNEYQVSISEPAILDFHCAQLLTAVLEKPLIFREPVDEMPMQFVSVVFMIKTNCPFKISIKFEDNIDPQFSLYEVNYNDTFIYNGNEGLENVYQMTEDQTLPIKLTFIGKNYFNIDKDDYSNKIKINIIASYSNDGNVYKEIKYSIIRFNSGFNQYIEYDDENIENINEENEGYAVYK